MSPGPVGVPGGGIAILGGSFNPLHVGHLRLAIEVHEALGAELSRVDILPCAHPPHKKAFNLLPFPLRVAQIRAACAPYAWLHCNAMEGERETMSYTWDTLGIYRQREPGKELFFVLGSQDYRLLPSWHRGLELPARCTLVVVPRGVFPPQRFVEETRRLWPEASAGSELPCGGSSMRVGKGRILCLPVPWLDVSASLIRARWQSGRCVDGLVPESVLELLEKNRAQIREHWTS